MYYYYYYYYYYGTIIGKIPGLPWLSPAFIALRCGWEVPDDILPDVEKFVCTMY